MLTGDLPFDCDNPLDLFDAIRDEPVPIPAEWPELQKDMVRRMLEKDPEKRITIDEMRVCASSCSRQRPYGLTQPLFV
jgi:serine/threonine protein kinase